MKKNICIKCKERRGRRQCKTENEKFICGECCGSKQLRSDCPKDCEHINKVSNKILEIYIDELFKEVDQNGIIRLFERYKKEVELLLEKKEKDYRYKVNYLFGRYHLLKNENEKALEYMIMASDDYYADNETKDKARLVVCNILLVKKDYEKLIDILDKVSENFSSEKKSLLESAYLASGRIYELLSLLKSVENPGIYEKYMLLLCMLILKKEDEPEIINLIDYLLRSGAFPDQSPERARLLGLKVKYLFKSSKALKAYETFENYKELINASDAYECREARFIAAYILYSVNKESAVSFYNSINKQSLSNIMIDEVYKAFSTMNLPPYIKAKAIEKSISILSKSGNSRFNRAVLAADILFEEGEYSLALDLYNRAVDEEEPDAFLIYKEAVCFMKMYMYDEAYELLLRLLNMTKYIPGAYQAVIRCCLELDIDWTKYFKALEIEKLNFNELYELAGSFLEKEHYDKAGYLFTFITEKYKNMDIYSRKMVYHNISLIYRKLKNYDEGFKALYSIPEKYADESWYIDLGCLYFESTDYQKAEDSFKKALEIGKSPIAPFDMGILNMRIGNYERAMEYFFISEGRIYNNGEESPAFLLSKVYKNISLCLLKLKKPHEALIYIDKSRKSGDDEFIYEVASIIQNNLLGKCDDAMVDTYIDDLMEFNYDFYFCINTLIEEVIDKFYGNERKSEIITSDSIGIISDFIEDMSGQYLKNKDSIEHSDETFQRFIYDLMSQFEKKFLIYDEAACAKEENEALEICEQFKCMIALGDKMFKQFEYLRSDRLIFASLIPYFKCVNMLSYHLLHPYYIRNLKMLPSPKNALEYRKIGVHCYDSKEGISYRVGFLSELSCSEYLFEINCHPGIRSKYLDFHTHYMPWNKLKWIVSGINKGWDVIDSLKSAGLLLLFYGCYKNYLGIEGDFKDSSEMIVLAGNLIHLGNEMDCIMRLMLSKSFEADYTSHAGHVRDLVSKCIEGLMKIKRI